MCKNKTQWLQLQRSSVVQFNIYALLHRSQLVITSFLWLLLFSSTQLLLSVMHLIFTCNDCALRGSRQYPLYSAPHCLIQGSKGQTSFSKDGDRGRGINDRKEMKEWKMDRVGWAQQWKMDALSISTHPHTYICTHILSLCLSRQRKECREKFAISKWWVSVIQWCCLYRQPGEKIQGMPKGSLKSLCAY